MKARMQITVTQATNGFLIEVSKPVTYRGHHMGGDDHETVEHETIVALSIGDAVNVVTQLLSETRRK